MAGIGPFYVDAEKRSKRRNRIWYQNNILRVLQDNKEKQVREVDASIRLAKKLLAAWDEKLPPPVEVPLHELIPAKDDSLMMPIEPEVLDIFYKSTEKGAVERYLKARNKKSPEEKYFFRICGSWDYGWHQKECRVPPRDINRGRCKILRETFYRRNNLAPDPPHYAVPSGGGLGICSEYSCNYSIPQL